MLEGHHNRNHDHGIISELCRDLRRHEYAIPVDRGHAGKADPPRHLPKDPREL